ncbi:hypothetical protein JCM1393_11240 [Clostridium carnis]
MNAKKIIAIAIAGTIISSLGGETVIRAINLDENLSTQISLTQGNNNLEETKNIAGYGNIRITEEEKFDISKDVNSLKGLNEGTIIIRFKNNGKGLQTLLGISNNKTNNGYFSFYVNDSRIGFELRNQVKEGNTSTGTENIAHEYADVLLNEGINTVALKVIRGVGYKLYYNGTLVKDKKDSNAKFISDINGVNSAFIGKADRFTGNEYLFKGDIDFLNVYSEPLSDDYILKITGETNKPKDGDVLPEGVIKTEPQNIFYPGFLGSGNYRIPALYTTKNGTVLATIDARKGGGHDSPNNIDTAIRRSEDGGKTWGEGRILLDYPDAASAIDTSLLQDSETGEIFLIVTHFPNGYGTWQAKQGSGYKTIEDKRYHILNDSYGNEYTVRDGGVVYNSKGEATNYLVDKNENLIENGINLGNIKGKDAPLKAFGTSYISMISSKDDGKTWSKPIDLNKETKQDWMKFMGTGPGRGIQIKNGNHKGRLVFPIYYTNVNSKQSSAVIYSDNHGKSWNLSESPNDGRNVGNGNILNSQTITNSSYELTESQVVEMPNGQLKLFMRSPGVNFVKVATSFDGGATWDEVVEEYKDLREPYCQLSVINYNQKVDGKDAIIFSNPDANSRSNGTVKIGLITESGAYKNGQPKYSIDWKYKKLVKPGYFAYSCLTELSNGNIGLFYEGTDTKEMSYIEMNQEYIKYNPEENASAAKVESVKLTNKDNMYLPGDDINLEISFDQVVSIMGDRSVNLSIGNTMVNLTLIQNDNSKNFIFKGKIPTDLASGNYDIVLNSNPNIEITNIYNKTLILSEHRKLDTGITIR